MPMNARRTAGDLHVPVLRDRIVELLAPALQEPGAVMVDATLGMGGHSEPILEACPGARVVGIDRDHEALNLAGDRLARFGDRFTPVHAVYDELPQILTDLGLSARYRCPRCCSTSECPRCSLTRRSAALPTGMTPRWTCGWTRTAASLQPTFSTPMTKPISSASCMSTAKSGSPNEWRQPSCASAPDNPSPTRRGWSSSFVRPFLPHHRRAVGTPPNAPSRRCG